MAKTTKPKRSTAELRRYLWDRTAEGRPYGADWRTDFPLVRPARPSLGTYDEMVALQMIATKLDEFELQAQGVKLAKKIESNPLLEDYSERHLRMADIEDSTRDRYILCFDNMIPWMETFLGRPPRTRDVTGELVSEYIAARKGEVARQTLRNELYALSAVMRRAVKENKADVNAVRDHTDIPKVSGDGRERKVEWLEIGEGARYLAACKTVDASEDGRRILRFFHVLCSTFLLTGGRREEVFGLDAKEIDFANDQVIFQNNRHRELKRDSAERVVPLWPQLRAVLEPFLDGRTSGLVFRAPGTGSEMLKPSSLRKGLRAAQKEAKLEKHVHPHIFRHTYAAARIQTLDGDHPVSIYTVMAELGHNNLDMLQRHYGHLMKVRHRSKVVEYVEAPVVAIGTRKRA